MHVDYIIDDIKICGTYVIQYISKGCKICINFENVGADFSTKSSLNGRETSSAPKLIQR